MARSLQSKAQRISLTIAENTKVGDHLIVYLKLVWGMLKTFASQFAAGRIQRRNPDKPQDKNASFARSLARYRM